jgi:hypothetical protein
MKTKIETLIIITGMLIPLITFGQAPPPPPPEHGTEGNVPSGGGTPIGGGLLILLGIGSAYGGYKGYKIYQDKKKKLID